MKKTHIFASATITAGLILATVWGTGCQKNETASGPAAATTKGAAPSAVKNSFNEVTSQLDPGGNLYGYLSTEQWVTGLSDGINDWRSIVKGIPGMSADDQQKVMRVFDVVVGLVKDSGIEDVSGAGISSIETQTNFYRTKFVLHHYRGQGNGFLWSMFGKEAHPLNGLDLLPANTSIAVFSDFDLGLLWSVVGKAVNQAGIPEAKDAFQKVPDGFAGATGLKLDQVLNSLGNEYGFVITLNESNKVAVPVPGQQMEIPEPGLMLVIKVKDDLIFNRVDELLKDNQGIIKSDKDGVKMRTMPVPLPLPMEVRPTIARSGDYLFLASSDKLINEALAVKAGKAQGLKSTEEFKKLAQGLPDKGNSFSYVSKKFGQMWADAQDEVVKSKGAGSPAEQQLMDKLMSLRGVPAESYSVAANTDEGWVSTAQGNKDTSKIVLLPAVVVPAVAAGVALPALAKAKQKAQSIRMHQQPPAQ